MILGNVELLLSSADAGRRASDRSRSPQAAERGAELTRQLLAFGRRQCSQPRVLDLNASCVHDAERMLRRLIGERRSSSTYALAAPGRRRALDRAQLEQVADQPRVNARDAMPNGGTLTLERATSSTLDEPRPHEPDARRRRLRAC